MFFRLYSDYIYEARFLQYNISRRDFHETVLEVIQRHKECSAKFSVRACAYNHSIDPFKVNFIAKNAVRNSQSERVPFTIQFN